MAEHYADALYDIQALPSETGSTERLARRSDLLLDVRSLSEADPELMWIAKGLLDAEARFDEAAAALSALPEAPGSLQAVLKGMYYGSTGKIPSALKDSADLLDRDQKARDMAARLLKAAEEYEAAKLLLPRSAKRFAGPQREGQAFSIGILEAWGYDGSDRLALVNQTGTTLSNCTANIALAGKTGETRQSIHFTRKWPKGQTFGAQLFPGIKLLQKPFGRTTVTNIQSVTVTLLSDELTWGPVTIQNDSRDRWIGAFIDSHLKPKSAYRPFAKGIIWDDQKAVSVGFEGIDYLPPGTMTVTLIKGASIASQAQRFQRWDAGTVKWVEFKTTDWDPTEWKIELTFDDNNVARSYRWTR